MTDTKTFTYKGRTAEITIDATNWGVAKAITPKKAIEIAYRADALGNVLRAKTGLRPVV